MGHTESDDGDLYHGKDHSDSVSADDCSSGSPPGGRILKKGPWTAAEDALLVDYVKKHGEGNWNAVQKHSGLFRCGKSCRLRWVNHLRPNLKKGAFTPEEERLIVELHARMGNKWARMATQLPGRTDNEIKNYWNTRIKRRQRNGLPLYPPEMYLQASNENQQFPNGCEFELDRGHHDLLHLDGFDVPPIIVDGIKAAHRSSPYAIQFSEISTEGILSRRFESSQDNTFLGPSVHRAKRVCDYSSSFTSINGVTSLFQHDLSLNHLENDSFEKVSWPLSLSTLYDPDQNQRGAPAPQTMISGSHALKNGDFSASNPLREVVKSELPSFQYFDCNLDMSIPPPLSLETVDTHIQSPRIAVRSDCMSPHSSGLLQDLIPEYHALNSSKHRSCESSAHSSVVPGEPIDYYAGNAWPEIIESLPPIIYSTVSSECNPTASYPVIAPSTVDGILGSSVKLERVDHVSDPNIERQATIEDLIAKSDESLSWFDERPESLKIRFSGADPINCLGGYNFPNNHKQQNLDISTSNESWGLGTISWCLPNV